MPKSNRPSRAARPTAWLLGAMLAGCATPDPGHTSGREAPPAPSPLPSGPPSPALAPSHEVQVRLSVDELAPSAQAQVIREAAGALRRAAVQEARTMLAALDSGAAWLLRARIALAEGKLEEADSALGRAAPETSLSPWVTLERGLLAQARGDAVAVVGALSPLVLGDAGATPADAAVARRAVLPLAQAAATAAPRVLVDGRARFEAALDPKALDARSALLEQLIVAHRALGEQDRAAQLELERWLEEPVSARTPDAPPSGASPTDEQLLARAEKLLEAHRSERVAPALAGLSPAALTPAQRCRFHFARGLAARKLRDYALAETHLSEVASSCKDTDLVRRARYLNAKVVSIRSGLRALPLMDAFAKDYADHSMTDDVLFWAGDLLQRRGRTAEASAYYERVESLAQKGDHCAEARWRLAWMPYLAGDRGAARQRLLRAFEDDGCVVDAFDRARASYWLARIAEADKDLAHARHRYREVLALDPLEFYAQLALKRLHALGSDEDEVARAGLVLPSEGRSPALCVGALASVPAFERARWLLAAGLDEEAGEELLTVVLAAPEVLAGSHANALGEAPRNAPAARGVDLETSCALQSELLLALMLDRAGQKAQAQWRLRTTFAELLARPPTAATVVVWRAAYPLAFREALQTAERESGVPAFFLQALAREESAFDEQVVSWAGAYGLTQLLLSTGRAAGALLSPKVKLTRAEELLEPGLNARLGAAYLASLLRRYGSSPALALAAYNAGEDVASAWWKRFAAAPFDVFVEEITIKETRGYVKRVLRTYGLYRWMYAGAPPVLPVEENLPARP